MRVHCPDTPTDITGCGREFDATPDWEGLFDCPHCGMWFDFSEQPSEGRDEYAALVASAVIKEALTDDD